MYCCGDPPYPPALPHIISENPVHVVRHCDAASEHWFPLHQPMIGDWIASIFHRFYIQPCFLPHQSLEEFAAERQLLDVSHDAAVGERVIMTKQLAMSFPLCPEERESRSVDCVSVRRILFTSEWDMSHPVGSGKLTPVLCFWPVRRPLSHLDEERRRYKLHANTFALIRSGFYSTSSFTGACAVHSLLIHIIKHGSLYVWFMEGVSSVEL